MSYHHSAVSSGSASVTCLHSAVTNKFTR